MSNAALIIIAWNVYIANSAASVRNQLREIIKDHKPHIMVLTEASKMYGQMNGLGYKIIHLKPKPSRRGNTSNRGDVAILVRNDIKILKRFTLAMMVYWLGPKHGLPQDPRVYRWVKVKFNNTVWKVGGAHIPFGTKAREESRRKLVAWVKRTKPGRPIALPLDANMGLAQFKHDIADPAGAHADGVGIDLILVKNALIGSVRDIGHHGSDHPAVKYTLYSK